MSSHWERCPCCGRAVEPLRKRVVSPYSGERRIGPWWLFYSKGLGGWSFYAFRKRLAWKPIDYSKTFLVEGEGRIHHLPLIHSLDLRRGGKNVSST